ncbi:MAG: ABC transporter ATP-binding protein [Actinomycetota bacterium]|nr:ABC transporter ATP-binding protein [Actinomycetota bacterium]
MSELVVRNLTAGYGQAAVVKGLSLEVGAGEIVGLLGRNGAGKTTTLRAISGMLVHVEGVVTLGGVALTGPAYRRARNGLGQVLEGRSVFPGLSVRQNLRAARVSVGDVESIFPELSSKLGLKAGTLSGGEQQMLAVARAICRQPGVLLLDEVSFGLAPIICERIYRQLDTLRASGMAVLVVEQYLHHVAEFVDRALVMHQGRVTLEMPGRDVLRRAAEIEDIYLSKQTRLDASQR